LLRKKNKSVHRGQTKQDVMAHLLQVQKTGTEKTSSSDGKFF